MTLQQLKYIKTVAVCGSITEAARQLFISQPSLSNAVRELENELGITIFTRTAKGISLSSDGTEFLSYANQVLEQTELLEQRYKNSKPSKQLFAVSTQHYAFAVNAFSNLIGRLNSDEYEFTLREARTSEIIEDVRNFRSEIGVLYINAFNEKVMRKIFAENHLEFHPLFTAAPHIFISAAHPLAHRSSVTPEELDEFPFLAFEQGTNNSFYFSEEILSTLPRKKIIHVSDRATLFNLVIGLNGYTICSGVLNRNLNGDNIVSVPLDSDDSMTIGYITNPRTRLSHFASDYIGELKQLISDCGYDIIS
ncbi:MAG: LysR family transcriptional regulator [Ruminococcus sp.]|nr:LysR family transcriptional regulator [Ruminococcus sp.]